jgi:hypothetical protein
MRLPNQHGSLPLDRGTTRIVVEEVRPPERTTPRNCYPDDEARGTNRVLVLVREAGRVEDASSIVRARAPVIEAQVVNVDDTEIVAEVEAVVGDAAAEYAVWEDVSGRDETEEGTLMVLLAYVVAEPYTKSAKPPCTH